MRCRSVLQPCAARQASGGQRRACWISWQPLQQSATLLVSVGVMLGAAGKPFVAGQQANGGA